METETVNEDVVKDERLFSRDDLTERVNQARAQAAREGKKAVLEGLGFESLDDLKTFISDAREAQEAAKTESEKREAVLAEREAMLVKREAAAAVKALELTKTTALAALGATGDNLSDAARLLDITAESTDEEIKTAAEALKKRHPGMFISGTTPNVPPVNAPSHPNISSTPGDYGARMADKYFGSRD